MRRRGFTLVELAVVTAITAVVFVAVSTAVGGGLVAWRKVEELARLTREGQRMARALQEQLVCAIASKTFRFEGTRSNLRFVMTDSTGGPVQVSWSVTPGDAGQPGVVTNTTQALPPLGESSAQPERVQRFTGVAALDFSFPMQANPEADPPYRWQDDWATDENVVHVPQAVRIGVMMRGLRGGQVRMERLAVLPQGTFGTVEGSAHP